MVGTLRWTLRCDVSAPQSGRVLGVMRRMATSAHISVKRDANTSGKASSAPPGPVVVTVSRSYHD